MRTYILTIATVILLPALSFSATIHIPGDKPTIQAGIDAAAYWDMVLVAPGTYVENIDFKGKPIILKSEQGPAVTVIDGGSPSNPDIGSVVSFKNGEGLDTVLEGFTLTNGSGTYYEHLPGKWRFCGGGIICHGASPTITNNALSANSANRGGGIYCDYAAPAIIANTITGNSADSSGGGICCRESSPVIMNNTITANHSFGNGGGIYCRYYSSLTISNNTITGNSAYNQGGGILCQGKSSTTIANSILWDNDAQTGSEIGVYNTGSIYISYSDVEGAQSSVYADASSTLDWGAGMIDQDPLFVDPVNGDFRLQQAPCQPGVVNPCVDSGDPSASMLPGSTRTDSVQDTGNLDMGYHYDASDDDGILHVPSEYPAIQMAIGTAKDGETVLVSPGTYVENIDFKGKSITVKSAQGPYYTVIDGNRDGSVVVCHSGEDESSVLEGFTITNGFDWGGGMSNWGSSPTVTKCIFSGNKYFAPGIGGGGVALGGGMYNGGSNPVVTNCIFSNNKVEGNGAYPGSSATGHGGGMYNDGSSPVVTNCIFFNNTAKSAGGSALGGGMFNSGSSPTVTNCTFIENSASSGGGMCNDGYPDPCNSTVTNCIFWNDSPDEIYNYKSSPTVTYSCIQGGYSGMGNIDSAPLFTGMVSWDLSSIPGIPSEVDEANGDYHLTFNSPCRGSGDNTAVTVLTDFEGDPRIAGGTVDMGADEFHTHLYWTGDAVPGGTVKLNFVGSPGETQVALIVGFSVFDPPLPGAYGDWHIAPPLILMTGLGPIPTNGVYVLSGSLPASVPGPYTLCFQSMIGYQLTNLCVMKVE